VKKEGSVGLIIRGQTPLFFYVANSINSLINLYEIILNKLVKKEK